MFYLHSNKHFGLVNICIFFFFLDTRELLEISFLTITSLLAPMNIYEKKFRLNIKLARPLYKRPKFK